MTWLTWHGWQVCCSWHGWPDTTNPSAFTRHGTVYKALCTTPFTRHENMDRTTNTVVADMISFLTRAWCVETIPSLISLYIYVLECRPAKAGPPDLSYMLVMFFQTVSGTISPASESLFPALFGLEVGMVSVGKGPDQGFQVGQTSGFPVVLQVRIPIIRSIYMK